MYWDQYTCVFMAMSIYCSTQVSGFRIHRVLNQPRGWQLTQGLKIPSRNMHEGTELSSSGYLSKENDNNNINDNNNNCKNKKNNNNASVCLLAGAGSEGGGGQWWEFRMCSGTSAPSQWRTKCLQTQTLLLPGGAAETSATRPETPEQGSLTH